MDPQLLLQNLEGYKICVLQQLCKYNSCILLRTSASLHSPGPADVLPRTCRHKVRGRDLEVWYTQTMYVHTQ